MTAATNTKVPLSPLAIIMVTLAATSTLATTLGFWVGYRTHPPREAGHDNSTWEGDLAAGFAALDQKEVDDLERRLRESDW